MATIVIPAFGAKNWNVPVNNNFAALNTQISSLDDVVNTGRLSTEGLEEATAAQLEDVATDASAIVINFRKVNGIG